MDYCGTASLLLLLLLPLKCDRGVLARTPQVRMKTFNTKQYLREWRVSALHMLKKTKSSGGGFMHATDYVFGYNFHLFKATLEDLSLERSQCCLLIQCLLVGGQQVKMTQRWFSVGESVFLCCVLRSDLALSKTRPRLPEL